MKIIQKLTTISLVCVFLIIAAGSIVRMTGSGMGCPDWPKCFGHTIPPTSEDQVMWKPNHEFRKGQMVVHEKALWISNADFTSGDTLNRTNWSKYTKHDYAIFNPFHTWVEFINRLVGAFTGLPVVLLFLTSVLYAVRSKTWWLALSSLLLLFLLGFEAWLGKLVVDGNLIPGSITIHMLGAVVMVVLLIYMRVRMKNTYRMASLHARSLIGIFFLISLLQLLIGTQVREEVDKLTHLGIAKAEMISQLGTMFIVHRSFSWLVLIMGALTIWKLWKEGIRSAPVVLSAILLIIQLAGGISLAWFDLPAFVQPLHLLAAIGLIGVCAYLLFGLRPRTSMSHP